MINAEPGEPRPLLPAPFQPRPLPTPPAEPRRPRPAARVAIAVVLAAAVVAGLFLASSPPGQRTAPAAVTGSSPAGPAPSVSPSPTERDIIDATLAAQNQALLLDDLDGYLAPVDPALHEWFRMRYASLQALGVARWRSSVVGRPQPEGDGRWHMPVRSTHCFGTATCHGLTTVVSMTWSVVDGRAVLVDAERTAEPWDLTPLRAVTGRRVIVAAPARYAGKLAATLATADQSADLADRFSHWALPPDRYVLYLAGQAEWDTWFGGHSDGTAYAHMEGGEVVQRADQEFQGLRNLLVHEFTHVVTIRGEGGIDADWWLIEGIAEYAADWNGSWTNDRLPFVRRYVRANRWDGSLPSGPAPERLAKEDAIARYGLALLAVTRLVQRYGEPAMFGFFASVVHDGEAPERAAPATLGAEWPTVVADLVAHLRTRAT
ncbi:hypothetical protein [Dactylosporangium sp. NPDC000521]|uniref:hypothetical protein n=1 Tax=Dactylosporangium sp. NPDC000521 TaxID=3363975 RepID=UPI0036977F94